MKNLFFLFIAFTLSVSNITFAQTEEVERARKRYPDETAIFLLKDHRYNLYVEKGQLKINSEIHEQMLINKETGIGYQSRSIFTGSFVEAKNIKAYTLLPKNNKYIKKEAEDIELKSNPGKFSFYDDLQSYNITFPFVNAGAITDITYNCIYNEPRFFGSFYFVDYLPILQNQLTLTVQKGIKITYKLMNAEGFAVDFKTEESKNQTIYKWSVKETEKVNYYNDAPNFKYFEPHLIIYVSEYESNGNVQKLLTSPADLYKWYLELQKNLNKTQDQKLKIISDSLVNGITDEFEKVKKIFYWVQDKISYVAFEDGMGGLVPRDAGLVCSRRFGDCKDMASLIQEMLSMAGIKSYLTWIGSREIPYKYTEVPTPISDNHMITTYIDKNGNYYFLDATGKNAPIEMYTSMIQGKEALIGISPDSFRVVTVPIKEADVSLTTDSITMRIESGVAKCDGKITLNGYSKLDYFYIIQNLTPEKADEFFQKFYSKGSNKTKFSNIKTIKDDREKPYTITYQIELPDYISSTENEMYINLNLEKDLPLDEIPANRKIPIDMDYCAARTLVTKMIVPDGYKVQFIPQNKEYKSANFYFSSNYELLGNILVHTRKLKVNTILLNPSDFSECNKMLKQLIACNKEAVSLTKNKP